MTFRSSHNSGLQRVYWIGGSFSGGKSTTCRLLAERHRITPYHYDRHLLGDEAFRETMVKDDDWFWRPNELKLERYRMAFPIAVEQIKEIAFTSNPDPILAEGPGLFPELLSQIGVLPEKVLYLLPTPELQRTVNRQRGPWVNDVLARKQEPDTAWEAWMKLDEEFANQVEANANDLGYRVLRNDGSLSPDEVTEIAEQQFGLDERR